MPNCRASSSPANEKSNDQWIPSPINESVVSHVYYFLANRPQIAQKTLIMKRYSLVIVIILAAVTCSNLLAEEKAALQPNGTVASLLQGSVGKSVELHLRSGEKMGGKIVQVTGNVVHLSNLSGAEYFDAFVDVKDISAVVVRVAGK
jgi:hypothetical protein